MVLAKVYSAAELGTFALYSAVFSVTTTVVFGKYENSLLYTRNSMETREALHVALIFSIFSTTILTALLYASDTKTVIDIGSILIPLAVASIFSAVSRAQTNILVRTRRIKSLTIINTLRPAIIPCIQIIGATISASASTLVIGHAVSWITASLIAFKVDPIVKKYFSSTSNAKAYITAVRYKRYPLYSLPQNLAYVIGEAAIPFLVAKNYGVQEAGIYWLCNKMVSVPSQVLTESIRSVVYRKIEIDLKLSNVSRGKVFRIGISLATPILILTAASFWLGNRTFAYFINEQWALAGYLTAAIGIQYAINSFLIPYIGMAQSINKHWRHLMIEIISSSLKVYVFYISGDFPLHIALLFGIMTGAIPYLFLHPIRSKYNLAKRL